MLIYLWYRFGAGRRERVVFLYTKEPEVQERFDVEQGDRKWLVVCEWMQRVDWASEIGRVQEAFGVQNQKMIGRQKNQLAYG